MGGVSNGTNKQKISANLYWHSHPPPPPFDFSSVYQNTKIRTFLVKIHRTILSHLIKLDHLTQRQGKLFHLIKFTFYVQSHGQA
jgi:hypothetical protein